MTPRHAALAAEYWLHALADTALRFDVIDERVELRDPHLDASGLAEQIEEYAELCDRQNEALRSLEDVSFKIIQEPSRLSDEERETYFAAREAVTGVWCNVYC